MAITVRHDISPEKMGNAAFSAGQGQKNRYEQQRQDQWAQFQLSRRDRLSMFSAEQEERRNMRLMELKYRTEQGQLDRSHELEILDLRSQLGREMQGLERAGRLEELDIRRQQDMDLFGIQQSIQQRLHDEEPSRMLERGRIENELQKDRLTWQYSEEQKRTRAKYLQGIQAVRGKVQSGEWTAQQGKAYETQLWAAWNNITPLPAYDDSPRPHEILSRGRIFDEETGRYFLVDPKTGRLDPLNPTESTDRYFGMPAKEYASVFINASKALSKKDEYGNVFPPAAEEVRSFIAGMLRQQGPAGTMTAEAEMEPDTQKVEAAYQQAADTKVPIQQRHAALKEIPDEFKAQVDPRVVGEVYGELIWQQHGRVGVKKFKELLRELAEIDGFSL